MVMTLTGNKEGKGRGGKGDGNGDEGGRREEGNGNSGKRDSNDDKGGGQATAMAVKRVMVPETRVGGKQRQWR